MGQHVDDYVDRIKELEGQRDALVSACDGLIDCLLASPLSVEDQEAIEKANAAIRAAQPEKEVK